MLHTVKGAHSTIRAYIYAVSARWDMLGNIRILKKKNTGKMRFFRQLNSFAARELVLRDWFRDAACTKLRKER